MFKIGGSSMLSVREELIVLLKEQTGLNSKQIAVNLNKIKKKFEFLKMRYNRGDF